MTPLTPQAMRASLDARIVARAAAGGIDAGRIRRRVVFQRILRRLGPDPRWVLKGGYLLEVRLTDRARTTKDLDLAIAHVDGLDDLLDLLNAAFAQDPDGDHFRLTVGSVHALPADVAGRGGWRLSITASLADRTFCDVRMDVVERVEESVGGTEEIRLDPPLEGTTLTSVTVTAVDTAQHAAEKFHAMSRLYAGGRPSTRVKDLLDIVLMAEAGLLPDARLGDRLIAVFAARDRTAPPADIPDPPLAWDADYMALASETSAGATTVTHALRIARDLYWAALG